MQINVPIWVEPLQFGRVPVLPIVDGVILNSPAMLAGIQPRDEIVAIDRKALPSRQDIRRFFSSGALDSAEGLEVRIKRNGQALTLNLKSLPKPTYPYDPELRHPGERFGMLFLPDFDLNYIDNIRNLTIKYGAKNVLLFCSHRIAKTVERFINQIPLYNAFFKERTLWIYALEDTLETDLTESRLIDDYEAALLKICGEFKDRPELILIPDGFDSAWGIDMNGRSVFEIENSTGIPVELVPWQHIYGWQD